MTPALIKKFLACYPELLENSNRLNKQNEKIQDKINDMGTLSSNFKFGARSQNPTPVSEVLNGLISDQQDNDREKESCERFLDSLDAIVDRMQEPARSYVDSHYRKMIPWERLEELFEISKPGMVYRIYKELEKVLHD